LGADWKPSWATAIRAEAAGDRLVPDLNMATTTQPRLQAATYLPLGTGWRELLTVASICVAMLGMLYLRTYRVTRMDEIFRQPYDHHKYIYMAQHNPLDFHIAPFSWRFLNPFFASVMPFGLDTNFLALMLIEILLTAVMVYFMLKAAGFGQLVSLTGLFLYWGLTQATKAPLSMIWLADPLTHLIIVTIVYLILIKRPVWAAAVLAIGCCSKEVVVLSAPLYYLLTAERIFDWKRFRRGILFGLPALAVFIGMRVLIPEMGSNPAYADSLPREVASAYNGGFGFGYWESAKVVIGWKLHGPVGWQLRALSVNTFGLLLLLPLFAIRENLAPALRWGPFVAAVYVSMILFSGSYERVLVICFPAVLIMSLNGLERLRSLTGASPRWPLALAMALVPLNWLYPKRIDTLFEVQALIFILFMAAILHRNSARVADI
jgi:hypothetical protein